MLLLRHGGEILLQKRPPSGIWGGLWSLPECTPEEDASEAARRLGFEADPLSALPSLSHTFSHFRLAIHPQPLTVTRRKSEMNEPGLIWLTPDEAREAALPAPVRRIIESMVD
jgi:A/G-specific adenine glycosylase